MDQVLFTNIPSELIIDIISRLPIRAIISCKCVCKAWLDLIESREFVDSHLSKSVPGLAVRDFGLKSESYRVFEFDDELNLDRHELHYNVVSSFDLPFDGRIHSSANGFLFLQELSLNPNRLYICNPITREYIELPEVARSSCKQASTYGFGVSKTSDQFKVVRLFHDYVQVQDTPELRGVPKFECDVYTLGTGSWRRVALGRPNDHCSGRSVGAFLNGNIHWLALDSNQVPLISCFDLETELFSTPFSPPPLVKCGGYEVDLFILENCLCICDNTCNYKIDLWVMKEYGVEKSWMKEFVISKIPDFVGISYEVIYPIKVFKDGDILMAWEDSFLFYYSYKAPSIRKICMFEPHFYIDATIHTPSFLTLKSFCLGNVCLF